MLVFTYLLLFTLSSLAYLPVTYLLCFTYITSNDVHADLCLFYLFTLIYFIFLSTTYLLKACFKVSSHHGPCTTLHPFSTLIPCMQHTHTQLHPRTGPRHWGAEEHNVALCPRIRQWGGEQQHGVLVPQNEAQRDGDVVTCPSLPEQGTEVQYLMTSLVKAQENRLRLRQWVRCVITRAR